LQQFIDISVGDEQLAACLHLPAPGRLTMAAPVVVCCHGLTGTRMGACYRFVRLARRLAEQNIACLRFDFRGCGESAGCFEDVCPNRLVEDLRAVMAALDHAPGCDPTRVGIAASSFGAYTTALVAEHLISLRCLALWAPVADVRALVDRDMTDEARALLVEHGWLEHRGLRLGHAFFDGIPDADAPVLLAKTSRPTLIFHADGDSHVPIEQGRAYESAVRNAGGEVQLETIESSDHGMRSVAANERILSGSVDWFRRFLHPELSPDSTV